MTKTADGEAQASRQPSHDAYWVQGEGKAKQWHVLGAAWAHERGDGYTVKLATRPFRESEWNGEIVLLKRKSRDDKAAG